MAQAAADGVAGDDEHARPRRRRRRHLEAGHGELAVAESSMHHSKSMQTHTPIKEKERRGEIDRDHRPKPKDMAWYIQAAGDFSKEPRNISSPFPLCFFHEEAMATRATKRETKGANKRS